MLVNVHIFDEEYEVMGVTIPENEYRHFIDVNGKPILESLSHDDAARFAYLCGALVSDVVEVRNGDYIKLYSVHAPVQGIVRFGVGDGFKEITIQDFTKMVISYYGEDHVEELT